jgi:hypothetical protein
MHGCALWLHMYIAKRDVTVFLFIHILRKRYFRVVQYITSFSTVPRYTVYVKGLALITVYESKQRSSVRPIYRTLHLYLHDSDIQFRTVYVQTK